MFAQLALLVAQVSSPMLDAYDQITPEVAAERVARCAAGSVKVRSMKEIDVDVLVVTTEHAITDEQIACIAKAGSFYDVELPPNAQPRLNAVKIARSVALSKAQGTAWLATHSLSGKLPEYISGVTDDEEFANKIEKLCRADGALHSRYGVHALSPDYLHRGYPTEDGPIACVLNVAWASGFEVGFIGNEQVTR